MITNNPISTNSFYNRRLEKQPARDDEETQAEVNTATPDPEFQPTVQWDDENKAPEKLGIDGVHSSSWTNHRGEPQQHMDNTKLKPKQSKTDSSSISEQADENNPLFGHMLVFSIDGNEPTEFVEENYLWIPVGELNNRQAIKDQFLSGRELILAREEPITRRSFEILDGIGKLSQHMSDALGILADIIDTGIRPK